MRCTARSILHPPDFGLLRYYCRQLMQRHGHTTGERRRQDVVFVGRFYLESTQELRLCEAHQEFGDDFGPRLAEGCTLTPPRRGFCAKHLHAAGHGPLNRL